MYSHVKSCFPETCWLPIGQKNSAPPTGAEICMSGRTRASPAVRAPVPKRAIGRSSIAPRSSVPQSGWKTRKVLDHVIWFHLCRKQKELGNKFKKASSFIYG